MIPYVNISNLDSLGSLWYNGKVVNVRILVNINKMGLSCPNRPGRDISDSQPKMTQVAT